MATFTSTTDQNRISQALMTAQPMPSKALRLVIHGHVQGVYFRDSMRREAQRLGVAGWVRNRSDGAVEAAVCGAAADIDAIVRWAHRGPEAACVEHVEIQPDNRSYAGFEILR